MKQLKALVIKDALVSRKGLLSSAWLFFGIYALLLVGIIIGYIRDGSFIHVSDYNPQTATFIQGHLVSYISNALAMLLPAILVGLTTLFYSSHALNHDVSEKCEMFHRCLPVSIWKISTSRYIVNVFGFVAMLFALGLINFIFMNIGYIVSVGKLYPWHFGSAFIGFIQSFIAFGIIILIEASILFALSGIFRRKALTRAFSYLMAYELLGIIFRKLGVFDIPSLIQPLFLYVVGFDTQANFMNFNMSKMQILANTGHLSFNTLTAQGWEAVLTWQNALRVLSCSIWFLIGTICYQYREVKE